MKSFRLLPIVCLSFWLPVLSLAADDSQIGSLNKPPNLVVIFIDDMGWGDFSCFGNQQAQTPNIDRLAKSGIRFEQFYVNSPICSPSRCALTTGNYPQRWRITSFLNNRADNQRRGMAQWLDPAAPTLPRMLKAAGYATGHYGKWHLGGQRDVNDAPPITDYGFDESLTNFEGMGPKLLPLTLKPGQAEPGRIWEGAVKLGGPVTWMQRSEITQGFVDAAIPFIDRAVAAEKPFYINLWPDDVHAPFWPPVEAWGDGNRRTLYHSVLQSMDKQLGKLFDRINNDSSLKNNTIILICSDNGPDLNAGSAGPFRGTKATLYEGGIRSPLIVWGPGLQAASSLGTVNQSSVFSAIDLVPSLTKIADATLTPSNSLDGEDLAETLLGNSNAGRKAPLFWRRPPDRKNGLQGGPFPDLAMRDGNWKLLCEYDGGQPELYDLSQDCSELKNQAADQQERLAEMKAKLLAWHTAMPADKGPSLVQQDNKPQKKTGQR